MIILSRSVTEKPPAFRRKLDLVPINHRERIRGGKETCALSLRRMLSSGKRGKEGFRFRKRETFLEHEGGGGIKGSAGLPT